MRIIVITILSFLLFLFMSSLLEVNSQTSYSTNTIQQGGQSYPYNQAEWVEKQIQGMTPDERIGQLFMLAAYSNKDQGHQNYLSSIIRNYKIGGLIFMQDNVEKQVRMTNHFQSISKVPLLIAMDAEWGLSMRLKDTPKFPRQLTLGAIQDNRLIYEMGKEIARQCKRMGVHINFAPVVDVNNNANNPVIGDRSFGEDKHNVSEKGIKYMEGMEQNGVIACAKHFPGHGDTGSDSHYSLPVINHDAGRLKRYRTVSFSTISPKRCRQYDDCTPFCTGFRQYAYQFI